MALIILLVLVAVAIPLAKSWTDHLQVVAGESPQQAAALAAVGLKMITALMGVLPLMVGAYLAYVSVKAWRTAEFPPPGTRVLRDTVVTAGSKSRVWAVVGGAVAFALIFGGVLSPLLGWRLAESLVQAASASPGP
jgi:hypothetical protein